MANEEKILEILTGIQSQIGGMQTKMGEMQSKMGEMQSQMDGIRAEMSEIKSEVKEIHQKLDDLTEAHEETRASVNALLDWAERASNSYDLPLPKLG